MYKILLTISLFLLTFSLAFGQTNKLDTQKISAIQEILDKYEWINDLNLESLNDEVEIKEYSAPNGTNYIVVKSENATTMYTISGDKYCTNHSELNCKEFYKLKDSPLQWKGQFKSVIADKK